MNQGGEKCAASHFCKRQRQHKQSHAAKRGDSLFQARKLLARSMPTAAEKGQEAKTTEERSGGFGDRRQR